MPRNLFHLGEVSFCLYAMDMHWKSLVKLQSIWLLGPESELFSRVTRELQGGVQISTFVQKNLLIYRVHKKLRGILTRICL